MLGTNGNAITFDNMPIGVNLDQLIGEDADALKELIACSSLEQEEKEAFIGWLPNMNYEQKEILISLLEKEF